MGDLDTRDGEAATKYISRMLKWDDHMLDTPINKLKKTLASPSYNGIVFVEHTWKQLKLPMSWYEEQCKLVDYDEEKILREIDLKRIHGSSLSPFKRSDIMYLTSHQKQPIDSIDISNNLCPFNIYKKLKPNIPYILVIDPSEGLAQDNNAVTMINPADQTPVMEFKSPYISQPELCKLVCAFMDTYCPKSMIVVEANKGRELINCFMNTKYKYNLYYDDAKMMKNISELVDKYGSYVQSSNERRAFGLSTTRSNRPVYYSILENFVEERKDCLYTEYLVADICGLIRKPNGRVEAGPGQHDDNIMSYLMGLYIYFNATDDLLERYGIIRGSSYDTSEYDDDGNLSEEAVLKRFREMMADNALPAEMQSIISETLNQRNEVDDTWDYYRELDNAQKMMPKLPSQMNAYERAQMERGFTQSGSPLDQSFWEQYDQQTLDSNDFGYDKNFNIEDYLD